MKLEDIELEWKEDANIGNDLSAEALKIPKLHSKWYAILMGEKKQLLALKSSLEELVWDLEHFYSRSMTQEELDARGWVYGDKKVLRQDIDKHIQNDERTVRLKCRISLQADKVEYVKDIIKMIHGRSFVIRDAIEYQKFAAGSY